MDQLEPTPAEESRGQALQVLVDDIERSRTLPTHVDPLEAADAVLCALAMRLPRPEADAVLHDVPQPLRLLLGPCAVHESDRPEILFDELAFLRLVASVLRISVEDAERVCRAVFVAVQKRMAEDEIYDVRGRLPRELKSLWHPLAQSGRAPFEPPVEPERVGVRPVEEPAETILRDIERSDVLPEGLSAMEALQAALCVLSGELTGHEAERLADVSRTLHRLLGPCVRHRGEAPQVTPASAIVHRLAEHLAVDEPRAERIARAVFAAVRGRLPADELHAIDGRLPRSVLPLWKPS